LNRLRYALVRGCHERSPAIPIRGVRIQTQIEQQSTAIQQRNPGLHKIRSRVVGTDSIAMC
jgi:hypothetical protein